MRVNSGFLTMAALVLVACGGNTNQDGSGGDGAVAGTGGSGASGATGGSGGSGATGATGGSGATDGTGATGGSGGTGATGGGGAGGTGGVTVGPRCGEQDFSVWQLESLPVDGFGADGRTQLSGAGPDVVQAICGSEKCVAERDASGSWQSLTSSFEGLPTFDVWTVGANDGWFSSVGGVIAHFNGIFTSATTPVTHASLWRAPDGTMLAVGDAGVIADNAAGSWQTELSPTSANLRGVSGSGSDDVFAVGAGGVVLHRDATTWSIVPSASTEDLSAVWSIGPGEAIAVGKATTLLHLTIAGTTAMPTTGIDFSSDLLDVWASAPDDAFAVGGPLLLYWNGTTWTAVAELESNIEAVWGSSAGDVYTALNGGGQVFHCQL